MTHYSALFVKREANTITDRENAWQVICGFVDKTVQTLHRVHHVLHGEVNWDNSLPLQITFSDGSILLLKGGSDGESLIASASPWIDPFEGKLDEENRTYIRIHGTWMLLDVTDKSPYESVIGKSLTSVLPITAENGTLCGVQMCISETYLNFVVVWDECHVLWGKNNPGFRERKVIIGDTR